MVSVPATRSAQPGFESWPGLSGLRGGRSLCEYCTNKLIKKKTRPGLAVSYKYLKKEDRRQKNTPNIGGENAAKLPAKKSTKT